MENKELRLEDKYWFGVFRWKLVAGLFILLLIVALGSDNEIRLVIPGRAISPLVWGCFCLIGATEARRRGFLGTAWMCFFGEYGGRDGFIRFLSVRPLRCF